MKSRPTSNQSIKPTSPLRTKSSLFATTPCRGTHLSPKIFLWGLNLRVRQRASEFINRCELLPTLSKLGGNAANHGVCSCVVVCVSLGGHTPNEPASVLHQDIIQALRRATSTEVKPLSPLGTSFFKPNRGRAATRGEAREIRRSR